MTSERQIAANRENAQKSTGPKTPAGKRRSRRNALRHGLTAETIIDVLEDPADYEAFSKAIHADFRPATNFETQLIARLVSLLWRLRRATAIESGLFMLRAAASSGKLAVFYKILDQTPLVPHADAKDLEIDACRGPTPSQKTSVDARAVARSFLNLASANGRDFERLSRYETKLWRQAVQVILLLNSINRSNASLSIDFETRPKFHRVMWPPFPQEP